MSGVPDSVKRLLEEHPALQLIDGDKKVRCTLTGHEIPAREEIIKLLLGGKKYQRKLKLKQFDYDQFKPHIVPSEKKWNKVREQLFCKLTLRHLNRDPSHVMKYVSGKRYKSALARWEECQRTGQPYHPRGGSRHKDGAESGSDDDDDDDDDDEDDDDKDAKPTPKKKEKSTKNKKKGVGKDDGWKDLEKTVESDDGGESSDSLADLYPAEDFEVDKSSDDDDDAQSGSDSEFDDDEEIPEPTKKPQKAGQKRKGAAETKQKPQKKKQKPNPTEGKKQKGSPNKGAKQKPNEGNQQTPNANQGKKQKQKKQKKKTKKLNNSVTLSI